VHTGIESIFRCQFHTAVVGEELRLVYKKTDLDDAYKEKRFGENVRVELLFESIEEYNASEYCYMYRLLNFFFKNWKLMGLRVYLCVCACMCVPMVQVRMYSRFQLKMKPVAGILIV
jgi:hypothetical protein